MPSGKLSDYLGKGLFANRPALLDLTAGAVGIYFATDTPEVIYFWTGAAWIEFKAGEEIPEPPIPSSRMGAYLPILKGTDGEFVRMVAARDGVMGTGEFEGSAKDYAASVLNVNKNGVKVGELTIAVGGTVTYSQTDQDWEAGDILTVTGADNLAVKGLFLSFSIVTFN